MSFFHPLEFLAQNSEGNEENVDNVLNAVEIVIALQTLVSNSCPALSPFQALRSHRHLAHNPADQF